MRWILGVTGLLLGLSIAIFMFGRIDHARRFAPDLLPDWTDSIVERSGFMTGRAILEGPASLDWTWRGIDGAALSWQLDGEWPGVSAQSRARFGAPFRVVLLDRVRAMADLSQLLQAPGATGFGQIDGELWLDSAEGAWDVSGRQVSRLSGKGRILNASFDGTDIGGGTFMIDTDEAERTLRLTFTLAGPVLEATGRLIGRLGEPGATLSLDLIPGSDMPGDWLEILPVISEPTEDGGWMLQRRLP